MQIASCWHECRAPFAYPVSDSHLRILFRAKAGDVASAALLYDDRYAWPADKDEAAPMQRMGDDGTHEFWAATVPVPTRRLRYRIVARGKSGETVWLTESGIGPHQRKGHPFQYAYLHRGDRFQQPDWIRDAIFYQIFPDRFARNEATAGQSGSLLWGANPTLDLLAGGNLAGIRQKLGYLRDLGINALYATPLFLSPSSHKYDTTDYYRIDPAFGTNEEFAALVSEAHTQGMRFLLDGVFNHCGQNWMGFQDVIANGEASPYRNWFYDLRGFPVSAEVCNYETFANQIPSMPKLDTSNADCAAYFLDVAEHWLRKAGIDGWRLDVANEVDHGFWRAFRDRTKSANPNAFLLGEVWHDASPWLQGDQFDSVMNYPWREATLGWLRGDLDALEYDRSLTRLRMMYPLEVRRGLLNLLGSHDTSRVRTELGSVEKAAQAAVLLLTSPGVPMIYYGDEIGMEGKGDVAARGCYPWDKPGEQHSGLLALYKRLLKIRRDHVWLNDGAWETICADPATNLLAFRRQSVPLEAPDYVRDAFALYVVLNNSGRTQTFVVPESGSLTDLIAGCLQSGTLDGNNRLTLPPHGLAILALGSGV